MIGIYKITNKINNKIYIGQSIDIERRWWEHKHDDNHNSLIHLAIKKYGEKNFTFEIIEECNQNQLDEREQYWIKTYNSFEEGYNLTRGGNSGFYYDITAIYKEYEKLQNIAQTAKVIGCSAGTVRKVIRFYGINHSEMQEDKPVEQIDTKTLKVIKTYATIQDAADAMKVNRDAISMAASGKHNSSSGYFWRFVGDNTKTFEPQQVKRHKRKVQQFSKEGLLLNEYISCAEAARSLGKDPKNGGSQIVAVCAQRKPSAYGYIWKYAD